MTSHRSHPMVGVVADDLTGANDTAVQFSKRGLRTVVIVDAQSLHGTPPDADIVVVNTATRDAQPNKAHAICFAAVEALRSYGVQLLYKKLDSTLRGNVGVELMASLEAFGGQAALVAPAFPAVGRITVGGYQLAGQQLTGLPAHAPLYAAEHAHLPTLLAKTVGDAVGHVALMQVRQSVHTLEQHFRDEVSNGRRLLVADAIDEHDLHQAARAYRASGVGAVIAGSGGLAGTVPSVWALRRSQHDSRPPSAPVVILAGSLHIATRRQLATLAALSDAPRWMQVHTQRLDEPRERSAEQKRVIDECLGELARDRDVVVSTAFADVHSPAAPPGDELGMRLRSRINGLFGRLAREATSARPHVGLVVTGGDIAEAVLDELGIQGLVIEDEVRPGIHFGRSAEGPLEGLRIISKAGGFGGATALVDALTYLKEEARHHDRDH